jgi:hypothetical protein
MPAEQVDAMVENRDARSDSPAAAARPGRAPLVTLLQELDRRRSITDFLLVKDGQTVVWRRA